MTFHYGDFVQGDKVAGDKHSYSGPVAHGDGQFAWGNQNVTQASNRTETVAPGFEDLAKAVNQLLAHVDHLGLSADELADARSAGDEVLEEVTKSTPDRRIVRRALTALKGLLAPIATGITDGGSEGAKEWTKAMIEHLTSLTH
jgi:hypothetical protein